METGNTGDEKKWVGYLAGTLSMSSSDLRSEVLAFSTRIRSLGIRCLKCGKVHEFARILPPCSNCSSTQYRAEDITARMTINCNRCAAVVMESVKCECGCVTPLNYRQLLKEAEPKKAGMCFIATAACGDPFAPEVIVLSDFRDNVLLHSRCGRAFVHVYYTVSPPFAAVIAKFAVLRHAVMSLIVRPLARVVHARFTLAERFYTK